MKRLGLAIAASSLGPPRAPDPASREQDFRFAADFEGFAGHFPGHPLLPAFVQVMVIASLAESLAPDGERLAAVEKAKFVREIVPGHRIAARCRRIPSGDRTVFEGGLSGPEGPAASMTLIFEKPRKCI